MRLIRDICVLKNIKFTRLRNLIKRKTQSFITGYLVETVLEEKNQIIMCFSFRKFYFK